MIVDEHVVLFGVDDGLDELTCVVSFSLEDLTDDVHDLGTERGYAHEDAFNDRLSESFKLCIAVLNELEGRVTQFIELR